MDAHETPTPPAAPTTPPPPYPPPYPFGMPAQPHQPARRGSHWRTTLIGVVAGGVLAAAIAVPSTWAITRDNPQVSPPSSSSGVTPPQQTAPDQGAPDFGFGQESPQTQSSSETNASDSQSQGVVLIDTTLTNGEAAGTGLVLDQSGLVLTNYHVVEGSTSVKVTIASSGKTYDAEVVGHDATADVALLQLKGVSGLTPVNVDQNGEPAVSDQITAIGNAEGQGYLSAASGTVVGLDKSITTQSSGDAVGEHLTGLIETDASVVGGYSGGALLDSQGEVVGITTAASSGGASDSYAVPIDDALTVANQIESGNETTDVQIGPSAYLGVAVAEGNGGVQIGEVQDGTPAADAGVAPGDTLVAIDGKAITSLAGLRSTMADYDPGTQVSLQWQSTNGRTHEATVTLAQSPIN